MEEKVVLIIENAKANLTTTKDPAGKGYILEGVFAEFGVMNNNQRIYEEDEYLPHLQYLTEKASNHKLLGELDHPERFDIKLNEVSHSIEELRYNKETRNITGRIRLLNTPQGKIAQSLIESGIPLSISSRAAGIVGPDKKVKIKKIFTYDLVADPGFSNAQLKTINESIGFKPVNESNIALFDVSDLYPNIEAIYGIGEDGITEGIKNKSDVMTKDTKDVVTVDQLHEWSKALKDDWQQLVSRIDRLENTDGRLDEGVIKQIQGIKGYLSYITNEIAQIKNYGEHLQEGVQYAIDTTNKVKKIQRTLIEYSEYLAERQTNGLRYTEGLGKHLQDLADYSDEQSKMINEAIKYSEKIADSTNKHIEYVDNSFKTVNEAINYIDYVAENHDNLAGYVDLVGDKLNEHINYTDYQGLLLDKAIGFSEYNSNEAKKNIEGLRQSINEGVTSGTPKSTKKTKLIRESVDSVIESAINETAAPVVKDGEYQFLRYLSTPHKQNFMNLPQHEKQIVCEALAKNVWFNERDIVAIMETAVSLERSKDQVPVWIEKMPEYVKPIWESLTVEEKQRIATQAQYTKLDSPYQIEIFWKTRNSIINYNPSGKVQKLDESEVYNQTKEVLTTAKTSKNAFIEDIGKQLKGKF